MITILDQTSGNLQRLDFRHGSLNDLQFSPDEHLLAIAAKDLGIYATGQPASVRLLRSDHENYGTVRFSGDGQTILVITGRGSIETIDARSEATRIRVCCSTIGGEVAFTPDGQALVSAGHRPSVWDADSGRLVARLTKDRQGMTFVPIAFDSSRGTILMGSQDGRVYVWDLTTRRLAGMSSGQPDYVDTLAVSPSGSIAYAAFGKSLRLWNPQTGEDRCFPAARPTSNLILSSDGDSVAFGTATGEIEFWHMDTGKRIRTLNVSGL